jgi:hypothetical protein
MLKESRAQTGSKWTKSTITEMLREDRLIVATGKAVRNRENKKDKMKPKEEWV